MAAAQIEIQSFRQVDMPEGSFPSIVIYDHPVDFPGCAYVARLWALDKPTNIIMKSDDIEKIRNDIMTYTPLRKITQDKDDDPVIAEVWF